jgi:hypothetical protein
MRVSRSRQATEDRNRSALWRTPVTLHLACASDRPALARLAQLDSRPLPPGPHLVAIRDGRIDAAISLTTGEVVANPFRRTAELCGLLRCHAGPRRVVPNELPARQLQPRPALAAT